MTKCLEEKRKDSGPHGAFNQPKTRIANTIEVFHKSRFTKALHLDIVGVGQSSDTLVP